MEKDVELITSGIVLIILGLVFRPLFVQLGHISPFILGIMWFPWALVAIGGFAFVLGILKLFGVVGFRTHLMYIYGFLSLLLAFVASIYVYALNPSKLIFLVPVISSFLALLYIIQLWRKASTKPTNDKKITIYNKWDFFGGLFVLFGAAFIFLSFPLSASIMNFWFPLILGTALGMSFIMFFTETGWYINTIIAIIIAIGDGAFSVPLQAMPPNQMGIIILVIGIAFFGNSFGFGTTMLLKSLKKKGIE